MTAGAGGPKKQLISINLLRTPRLRDEGRSVTAFILVPIQKNEVVSSCVNQGGIPDEGLRSCGENIEDGRSRLYYRLSYEPAS
jgi:hypothetical protein